MLVMAWLWDVVGPNPLPAKVALVMMVWMSRGWCTCIVCLDFGWGVWVAWWLHCVCMTPMHAMLVCFTHFPCQHTAFTLACIGIRCAGGFLCRHRST